MQGWIKLHRKFVDWEWYDEPITKIVFIDLLLYAAHQPTQWRGQKLEVGTCVTSLDNMASRLNISVQQLRTALSHLQKTGEINKQSTNKNTTIIVLNYKRYQELMSDTEIVNQQSINNQSTINQQSINNQSTINQQSINNQATTYKNVKNVKNVKNEENISIAPSKKAYGEYRKVWLTDDEYNKLTSEHSDSEQLIAKLDKYKEKTGKYYNSDYVAILDWVVKAVREEEAQRPAIDSTFDINSINRCAMLNEHFEI